MTFPFNSPLFLYTNYYRNLVGGMIKMKRTIISIALGIFLVGTTQEVFATEELPINHLEISQPSNRATVRYHFKSIPPLKYKGKNRIDYFPYDGGYTGVYL